MQIKFLMKSKKNKFNLMHLSNTAGRFGGGISEVVHSLINQQKMVIKNISLWFHGNYKDQKYVFSNLSIRKENMHFVPILLGFFTLNKLIKFISIKNPKIIHQHGVFMPLSILSIILSIYSKIIINPHGLLEPEKFNRSKIKKKIVLFLYEKFNLKRSHCLVACSKKEANSLKKMFPNKPISIIPNGVDEVLLNEKINDEEILNFKKKFSIPINKKILLFLSRIHPWKGLILLLNVINDMQSEFRNNNWIFLIAGSNENDHLDEIISIINEKKINDIVYVIGPQYSKNKIISYEMSSCYVLPSKGENFGITIIEAMSRSKPVITTTNTPWSDLNNYSCGWWINRNKHEFKNVLINLLSSSDDKLKKMGSNGKKLVIEKYTWNIISQQFIDLYNWVLNDYDKKYQKDLDII